MVAITTDDGAAPRIQIGWVVSSSLKVIFRRGLDLLLLALPLIFLPNVVIGLLPGELRVLSLGLGLPGLVFVGGATLISYRELAGETRLTVASAMGQGAQRFGSLWALAFVRNLALLVALLALLVPGLILMAGWMPATAIMMVEKKGSTEALGDAWRLTKGSRWRIAAVMAIQFAALALGALLLGAGTLVLALTLGRDAGASASQITLQPLFQVIFEVVLTVTSTACYVALRHGKQGAVGDVAEVFA
jgi:hypothetical protein